jgi:competence protein ComFB
MKLTDRYNLDAIANRSQELVHAAVARLLEDGTEVCRCPECVADLVAWTLNHVTPRYATSLLAAIAPDEKLERRIGLEIDLALRAGLKRLRQHPHHG